jgi:DNA-directed RNA polymerase specialized sigma24 family protein
MTLATFTFHDGLPAVTQVDRPEDRFSGPALIEACHDPKSPAWSVLSGAMFRAVFCVRHGLAIHPTPDSNEAQDLAQELLMALVATGVRALQGCEAETPAQFRNYLIKVVHHAGPRALRRMRGRKQPVVETWPELSDVPDRSCSTAAVDEVVEASREWADRAFPRARATFEAMTSDQPLSDTGSPVSGWQRKRDRQVVRRAVEHLVGFKPTKRPKRRRRRKKTRVANSTGASGDR